MIRKLLIALLSVFIFATAATAFNRGIYINSSTMNDTQKITWLIAQSQKYNIDTFVIDMERVNPGETFKNNARKIVEAKINFIARVVVFPGVQ